MSRSEKWRERLETSEHALALLFFASFLETTVLPIPIEVVLIPYMLTHRDRLWLIATVTLAGCLAGALVGYGVGFFLFESLGTWLIDTFGWQQSYQDFQGMFERYGFWAIIAIGVTPIPFQVAMLVAGTAGYSILLFLLAAAIARGVRYYGLALLVHLFGERAMTLWQRHSTVVSVGILGGVIVGVAAAVYFS